MSDSDSSGCLGGVFVIVINVVAWLAPGYVAWNWIEPDSFWGAVKFIIAWGVLGYIAQFILSLVVFIILRIWGK